MNIKIPKSMLMFPVAFGLGLVCLVIIFAIQIFTNVKILNYHIILVLFVALFGLFYTSLSCIEDFKRAVGKDIEK